MNTFGRFLLVLCSCLISLCFAAPTYQTIKFDGLAATLVEPAPYKLTLAPLNINDPKQQWFFDAAGYISNKLYPDQVFDVVGFSTAPGTRVGLWTKKPLTENPLNQLWRKNNGALESQLAPKFFLHPIALYPPPGTALTADYWDPPKKPLIEDVPPFRPLTCSSAGDPHIVPFGGGHPSLNSPGVQQPGDYALALFGNTRVVAHHSPCGNRGAYCNSRVSVEQNGPPAVVVTLEGVTFNGNPITVTGTQQLTPDISITRHGEGDYTITVPCGTIQSKRVGTAYMNAVVSVTCGSYPEGGLCFVEEGRKRLDLAAHIAKNKIKSICDSPFNYPSLAAFEAANPTEFESHGGNATTTDPLLLANATLLCTPLKNGTLVTQCAAILPPAPFHQSCMDDVILMEDFSVAATIIDGYAIQCALLDPSVTLPASGGYTTASGTGLGDEDGRVPLNRLALFTVQARDALRRPVTVGGDAFEVTVVSGPTPRPTFTITDLHNGRYTVLYNPTVAGTYTIDVKLRGVDRIVDSPFSFNVVSFATDPSQTTVENMLSPVRAGRLQTFDVQARTSWGANQTLYADAVTVAITGAASHSVLSYGGGSFSVNYRQNALGSFSIDVKINNARVQASPFIVYAE